MYVCICKAVTDREIRAAVHAGTTTVAGLRKKLGCTGQCGGCRQQVRQVRNEALAELAAIPIEVPGLSAA